MVRCAARIARAAPWSAIVLVSGLHGSAVTRRTLPQDAYVWQRVWTPGLETALRRTAPLVQGWRVLAAEWSVDGRLVRAGVDWTLLGALARPVTAVLRVDGRHVLPPPEAVADVVAGLPAGALAGVEVDYDCPTARLDEYRAFLQALRPRLPPGLRLSITALPDWLSASALAPLSREADQLVLQVHAVDDPRRGLFSPSAATRWARLMAARSARPFLVSLPAYGVRVVQSGDGRVLATEAERPALAGGSGVELAAVPELVEQAVDVLEQDPPPRLAGLVWFRVPSPADARSWSLDTWEAVLRRRVVPPRLVLRPVPGPDGLSVLRLANDGAIDAPLPRVIALAEDCTASDGAGPYGLERDPPSLVLRPSGGVPLHPGQGLTVGWTRCAEPERVLP